MTAIPLSRLLSDHGGGDRLVAWNGESVVPFARFRADVAANAARLAAAGCKRATLACGDTYHLAVGLFALLHAGACPMLSAIARPETSDLSPCVVGDGDETPFRILPSKEAAAGPLQPLDPRRTLIDFFTSGSTGEPKRVTKPLLMLEREIAVLDELWGFGQEGVPVLATVPHHHVYGLTFKVLWPLSAGHPFARRTHGLWEEVAAELPAGAVLVTGPSHLGRISGLPELPMERRPRMVLSAGAPLTAAAAREAASVLGIAVTEIFGSSETGVIANRRCDGEERPWRPFPGVVLEIASGGTVRVRSPFLAEDGWYETVDVARPTPDGFRLLGRADRVVKVEGKRVSLPEVERQLGSLPQVAAAAVVALPGEPAVLGAAVLLTEEGRAELASLGPFRFGRVLRRALSASGEPTAMPRRWRFPNALPVDAMGKRRDGDVGALFGPGMEAQRS